MEVQLSTMFFLLISTVVLPRSTTAGDALPPTSGEALAPTPAPEPTSDDTEYIRSCCETTRYPDTCFATLSNYSGAVRHDSGRLATVAIHVALHNATHMARYVSNMSRQPDSGKTREFAALCDCESVFEDAVDQINKSIKEMRQLGWTGESVRFQLSNVQTWMSAALTNEDTCMDGFEGVADGGVKADVCGRVVAVEQVTSNALALVNRYADTISVRVYRRLLIMG
ncbi:putative pectinesterase [Helianthus annuus]|nr:putative pectinesterase [Helianthus annuus]